MFGATATLAVIVAVVMHRPPHPGLWLLLALGFGLWTAGDTISALLSTDGGNVPVPSLGDVCYLAGYAALILGVGLLAGPVIRGSSIDRPALLDAAILATTAGFVVWLVLVNPLLAMPGVDLGTAVVSAAYPILDILLIAVVARHLLINGPKAPAALLLAAGIGAYLLADLANVAQTLYGTYSAASPVNAGWLFGYALSAAAVLHPSMRTIGTRDSEMRPMSLARRLLLASAAIVPTAVILFQQSWEIGDRLVLGAGSTFLTGLVLLRLFGAVRDQARLRQRSHHEARHDALTSLANRTLFSERLGSLLESSAVGVGLLYLDLDDFKSINDTLGHPTGDEVLRIVADRLRMALRAGDDVARLGGDEFAVIVDAADGEAAVVHVARRIIDALVPPADVGGCSITLQASIGIAWGRAGQLDASEMLRRADVAMYRAKATRSIYAVYGTELDGGSGAEPMAATRTTRGGMAGRLATAQVPTA